VPLILNNINYTKRMDRLTELQGYIDDLGRLFYTSIGAIQRDAPPANLGLLPKVEKKDKGKLNII